MSEVCKSWVICWKPFRPDGTFITVVDFSQSVPVKAGMGLDKAQRFFKAEIPYVMEEIGNYMAVKRLLPVDLGDHFFGE